MSQRSLIHTTTPHSFLAQGRAGKVVYPSCPIQMGSRGLSPSTKGHGNSTLTWEELLGRR